jgi:hypothetical protein
MRSSTRGAFLSLAVLALGATLASTWFVRAAAPPTAVNGKLLRVLFTGDNTGEIEPCG